MLCIRWTCCPKNTAKLSEWLYLQKTKETLKKSEFHEVWLSLRSYWKFARMKPNHSNETRPQSQPVMVLKSCNERQNEKWILNFFDYKFYFPIRVKQTRSVTRSRTQKLNTRFGMSATSSSKHTPGTPGNRLCVQSTNNWPWSSQTLYQMQTLLGIHFRKTDKTSQNFRQTKKIERKDIYPTVI